MVTDTSPAAGVGSGDESHRWPRIGPNSLTTAARIGGPRGECNRYCGGKIQTVAISMKPAPFTYHAPASVDEAVALLAQWGPQDGRVLAGGQSLIPTMAFRVARPAHLIDINGIAELGRIVVNDGVLSIGACV